MLADRKLKYFFVYPPLMMNSAPLSSIPQLIGLLESNNVTSKMYDLNAKFYSYRFNENFLDQFKDKYVYIYNSDFLNKFPLKMIEEIKKPLYSIEQINKVIDFYKNEICFAKQILKDEKMFYNPLLTKYALKILYESADLLLSFEKKLLYLLLPQMEEYTQTGIINNFKLNSVLIKYYISSYSNVFLEFIKEQINDILIEEPDCIGITINTDSQIFTGLSIGYFMKSLKPNIHINIGGSYFANVYDKIENLDSLFGSFFDSITYGNGDTAALSIINFLNKKIELKDVPNIISKQNTSIYISPRDNGMKISDYPYPSFSGYERKEYFSLEFVLPVQASYSCYWGRCKFCNSKRDRSFQIKNVEKFVEEIEYLSDKYDTKYFYMWDNALHPKFLDELAKILIEKKLGITYSIYARFEKEFNKDLLKKLRKSGCVRINWGLDATTPEVLKYINKGINIENVPEILKNANRADISNLVSVIFGYPNETKEQIKNDINFLIKNKKHIDILMFSPIVLFLNGSEFYKNIDNLKNSFLVDQNTINLYIERIKRAYHEKNIFFEIIAVYNLQYANKYSNIYLKFMSKLIDIISKNKFLFFIAKNYIIFKRRKQKYV